MCSGMFWLRVQSSGLPLRASESVPLTQGRSPCGSLVTRGRGMLSPLGAGPGFPGCSCRGHQGGSAFPVTPAPWASRVCEGGQQAGGHLHTRYSKRCLIR